MKSLLPAVALCLLASCKPSLSGADALVAPCYLQLKEASDPHYLGRVQAAVRDSLDMAVLHESTLWHECLAAWVSSYPAPDSAAEASKILIERVAKQSPLVRKPLVRELCLIFKGRGNIQTAATVAAYPHGIDGGKDREISYRLLTSTLLPGRKAPVIEGLLRGDDTEQSATLLLFYESRCRTCQQIIRELEENYPVLREKGVRVVSLSIDTDEKTFAEYCEHFPWPDKLCDYRGEYGPNMERFGVATTPTLFLIDEKGIVTDQYDTPEEVWKVLLH